MIEISLNEIRSLIISAPRPLLFLGPPGIGKSEIIKDTAISIAKQKGKTFVDLAEASSEKLKEIIQSPEKYYVYYRIVAPQVTPEDIRVPKLNEHYFDSLAPLRFYVLSVPGIEGILFIDEITNIQREDVMTLFFALIQERQLGDLYIQPTIKIVMAGNRSEHSSVARALPLPLLTRMLVFNVSPPELEKWAEYMNEKFGDAWDKRILAYLYAFKHDFIKIPEDPEGFEPHPCPRSWTNLALMITNIKNPKLYAPVCVAAVGSEVGAKVATFLKKQPPKVEEILANPAILGRLDIETKVLAMYSLAQNIDVLLKAQNTPRTRKLLQWLYQNDRELMALFTRLIPSGKRAKFISKFMTIYRKLARFIAELYK